MWTPCDEVNFEGKHVCPYQSSPDDPVSCRDYCGLGVDEDDSPDEEYDDYDYLDDYDSNMHCDTYGVCGGTSCPNYFSCQH